MALTSGNMFKQSEPDKLKPEFKPTIGIVGYGYVGQAMHRMFRDKYECVIKLNRSNVGYRTRLGGREELKQNDIRPDINKCDLTIICVPTPMKKDEFVEVNGMKVYRCDTSIVEGVVEWCESTVIMIKSTIEVGTVDRLKEKYPNKRIVFSPEYVGEGSYYVTPRMDFQTDAVKTPFFICGGDQKDCEFIFDILTPVMGPECHYKSMPARDAEFVKYIENDYFAHKVVWANEKRKMAEALGVNWHNAREGWGLDPRVDKMHTGIFVTSRGYSGKCLPKDMNAIMYASVKAGYTPTMEVGMLKSNMEMRGKTDQTEI